MTMYNATIELDDRGDLTDDRIDELHQWLGGMHATIGKSARGFLQVHISLMAEGLGVASMLALANVQSITGRNAIRSEIMTEAEFNAREGFVPVPELVSSGEFAEIMGISRPTVAAMIERHELTTAQRVGGTTVIAAREALAKAIAAGRDVSAYSAVLGESYTAATGGDNGNSLQHGPNVG